MLLNPQNECLGAPQVAQNGVQIDHIVDSFASPDLLKRVIYFARLMRRIVTFDTKTTFLGGDP